MFFIKAIKKINRKKLEILYKYDKVLILWIKIIL